MYQKRNCFCCDKRLYSSMPHKDDFDSPIEGGVYFRTYGNYGSTVFDCGEFNNEQVEIYICDECLKSKSDFAYLISKDKIEVFKNARYPKTVSIR